MSPAERERYSFQQLNVLRYPQLKRIDFHIQIQGGDPTGTGKAGESSWGPTPFADEFKVNLSHTGRGILNNNTLLKSYSIADDKVKVKYGKNAWRQEVLYKSYR